MDRRTVRILIDEVDEAASLLRHGTKMLRELRLSRSDAPAMFALLAIGVEKMLKMTLGIVEIEEGGSWPTRRTHDLVSLDHEASEAIDRRCRLSTAPGHIADLLVRTRQDPTLSALLGTLTRFAKQGRFYNLDDLALDPQNEPSPAQLWEELLGDILDDHTALTARLGSPDELQARLELNGLVATSLDVWWELYVRAWMTGVLGDDAKALAACLR